MQNPPAITNNASRKEAAAAWVGALEAIQILQSQPNATLPSLLDGLAVQYASRPALLAEHEQLDFQQLAARANSYAAWAAENLAAGDVVALLLPNSPDYAALWLGLTKAGCIAALLNTNLAGDALSHCIAAAAPACVIAAAKLHAQLPRPAAGIKYYSHGGGESDLPGFGQQAATHSQTSQTWHYRQPKPADVALLIYTSGTTGLPKAARVTHGRLMEWSFWFAGMMNVQPTDRLYNCLPMYHSTGGVVAVGAMLVRGGSVLIRERFSARNFWADIVQGECTIFQYIGELCRYLVNTPPGPAETLHSLRLCCGNGLRADVWEPFQARFNIPRILEFYASTEGNFSLYNAEGKPGAIGRIPPYLTHRFPVALIQCDLQSGAPRRDDAGFCIPCQPDQPGEAVGKIAVAQQSLSQFDGYTDPAASSRKLLHDVFAPGDCWFRTGDLMRKDAAGFYYFVDRLGDTFRWKGENVSTTEVANVINACPGITLAAVYGIEIFGKEGRAGMAAISTTPEFSHTTLIQHLVKNLPAYARPVFIRLCETLQTTGTFKLQTVSLALEATNTTDPLWEYDYQSGTERKV